KLDRKLGKVEETLQRGTSVGQKVEHGLDAVSRVAGVLGDLFGHDFAIGRFAQRVHGSAEKRHDKLHSALEMATRAKAGLQKGRALLEEALHFGAPRHVEQAGEASLSEAPARAGGIPGGALPEAATAAEADPRAAAQAAAEAVAQFGSAVGGAVKAAERLIARGRSADAAGRGHSIPALGDRAAEAGEEGLRAGAGGPALPARAANV